MNSAEGRLRREPGLSSNPTTCFPVACAMTYDSSNPFHQLENIFPSHKAKRRRAGQPGLSSTGEEHASRDEFFQSDTDISPKELSEDDASLFLRAMNAGDFAQNPGKSGGGACSRSRAEKKGREESRWKLPAGTARKSNRSRGLPKGDGLLYRSTVREKFPLVPLCND